MTKRMLLVAVQVTALILCADACKAQTILGKHPADKVLPGFWNQNGNADTTISGLGSHGTVPWNLNQATVGTLTLGGVPRTTWPATGWLAIPVGASATNLNAIGTLTLGGVARTTWPATGWTAIPYAASATNLNLWLDPTAGGQDGMLMTYPNGNTALFWASEGSFSLSSPDGNLVLSYSAGGVGADQIELQRDGGRPVLVGASVGTLLYDQLGHERMDIGQTSVAVEVPLTYELLPLTKVANYTVVAFESGAYYNNNGASGTTTNTLPIASPGLHYHLAVLANQNVAFKAAGADTIGDATGSGTLVYSATLRSTLHLICLRSGEWVIDSERGTWTIQ